MVLGFAYSFVEYLRGSLPINRVFQDQLISSAIFSTKLDGGKEIRFLNLRHRLRKMKTQ